MAAFGTDGKMVNEAENFVHVGRAQRVCFGRGTLAMLAGELEILGSRHALLLTTAGQGALAAQVVAASGGRIARHHAGARMHTPAAATDAALAELRDVAADALVSAGGGSATGLGKALALRTGLLHLSIPTTYAGSEMTPILGETVDGRKTTLRDPALLPASVIYDVDLTFDLPAPLSAASGMNAMAHAVEALYARDANPLTGLMAEEAVRVLAAALPAIRIEPRDRDVRWQALYGAWLAGTCLGTVGMALHHKLCHVLGGSFDLPHAQTHCIILPYVVAYNAPAAQPAMARLARALGSSDPATALWAMVQRLGVPCALGELGLPDSALDEVVRNAAQDAYWNPRPVDPADLTDLLRRALAGSPPVP